VLGEEHNPKEKNNDTSRRMDENEGMENREN